MIMKANKQIGFIYKDNESIDKILKDGDVVFERGFLRERTTTTLPITFGGVGKDLKDYKIYGNTYQNSTSGKNKYGITSAIPKVYRNSLPVGETSNLIVDEYDLNNIKFHTIASGLYYQVLLPTYQLEPNTNYIVSYTRTNTLSSGASARRYIYNVDANNNYSLIHALNSGDNGNMSYTFETTETGKVAIAFGFYNNQSVNESEINNLMIRLATDIDDTFEPYTNGPSPNPDYPQEIISVGDLVTDSQDEHYGKYKIPVNVRSENLYDKNKNTQNYYLDINGNNESNTSWDITDYIPVIPNNNYTYKGITNTGIAPYCAYYDKNKNFVSTFKSQMFTNNIVIPNNIYYIRFSLCKTSANYNIGTFEIISNETTNIYLDEPLRKIGEYSDYIDFANGKVVRNIKEHTFTSDDAILSGIASQDGYARVGWGSILEIAASDFDKTLVICNKFLGVPQNDNTPSITGKKWQCSLINTDRYKIMFRSGDLSLNNQGLANLIKNNTKVCYPLATPTEESITLPNIPTIEGNNTLNIETEITPSQVYIKYKSNE